MSKTNKKTIPTIIGIFILTLGVVSGVVLLNVKQIFKLGAEEDVTPKNVQFSNVEDDGFSISFITSTESRAYVKVSEDRYFLNQTPLLRENSKTTTHYFNVDGLDSDKEYFISINVNGFEYFSNNPKTIRTGHVLDFDAQAEIIYGKIYSTSGEELENAIVFAQNGNSSLISTQTAADGTFILNLAKTRSSDLSTYMKVDEDKTIVSLFVQHGDFSSSVSSYLKNSRPFPPIILGNNIELKDATGTSNIMGVPTPSVYGSFDINENLPLTIKNIYKERAIKYLNPNNSPLQEN